MDAADAGDPGRPIRMTRSKALFAGQFVGGRRGGPSAPGRSTKATNAEKLTASFGVEKGEDVPETVTDGPTGGGVMMTRITGAFMLPAADDRQGA